MSDFAGLQMALSALYAQRRGLEITGHNVANANTLGYSRQRLDLQAISGPRTGSFWPHGNRPGQGVHGAGFSRDRADAIHAATRVGTRRGADKDTTNQVPPQVRMV